MSNRVCKFYARGACLKGEQCDFAHERKDDICSYYQRGFCAYGSRCRYKHVNASQASSSANGRQSQASDSVVSHTTRGTSSWVPKAVKSSSSDKRAKGSQCKHMASTGNGDVGESSARIATAITTEHLFCTFAAANCPLGDKCSHIHGNQCLYCRKFCLHPADRKEKENHLRTCEKKEKYLLALNDSKEIECNVCLERVLSKPKQSDCKFGLLPECDHAFCLSCIRNWRNSAPTSGMDINNTANTVRSCPVCRKLSYFVIPSGIWYSTQEEKQEIIDNYKANCKLIDCKHFNSGNGNCPFGNICFYKESYSKSGGAAAGSSVPATSRPAAKRKNASGSRTDIAWKHGVAIDENDSKRIKCKYCGTVVTGGAYRFKHHLGWSNKDTKGCPNVSDEVKEEMRKIVLDMEEKKGKKRKAFEESIGCASDDVTDLQTVSSENISKRKGKLSQATINTIFKKEIREDACRAIARFFYNNAIPFNVAKSDEFQEMCAMIAKHGQGFQPPSYHQIRVKYLKEEVKLTTEALEVYKKEWQITGCSIMTDGWTDKRRRTILNFLVNSPMGTIFLKSIDASHITKTADKIFQMLDDVVEEVGEENVVQVVTDNAANYKAAGEMLMQKRTKLYWTPCAAHCIDLMLEDFEKKIPVHQETIPKGRKITSYIYSRTSLISLLQKETKGKELIRLGITRFATSYLTLGSLHDNKGALIRMFTGEAWKNSRYAKTRDGSFVEDVVMDKVFWKNVVICLKGAIPLIKVLRIVDSDVPAMGFIYEEMDQAKELIQKAFKGVKKSYQPLWDIIDERWDRQLHRPLHVVGYFFNPQLHYNDKFKCDLEVKRGLLDCLTRMIPDEELQTKVDVQMDDFKNKVGMFGTKPAFNSLTKRSPANWWGQFGDEVPELKQFAMRILNLTCSSSGCERNWSAFEMHTVKPGSYMWIHGRPPPQPRRNHFDMYDVLDMLNEVDLSSAEYYSIMRDSEFFNDMDPFEMMAMSDRLAGGSGPCLGPFDSDDEDMDMFRMAAFSEALVNGVDDFGPEDFDDEDFNPMEAALLSMMMHSNMEEEEDEEEEDEDEEDEDDSDEDY